LQVDVQPEFSLVDAEASLYRHRRTIRNRRFNP
jgi:hypothetical protein